MNNKGFTLVEVLAAVAIIAILGLIATPSILSMINTSKNSSYDIMVDNIRVAAESLYQEIELFGSINPSDRNITLENIYYYDKNGTDGITRVAIDINDIDRKFISVNLQSLVSNGFLTGKNNDKTEGENKNKKMIINPKTNDDIGNCKIEITKKTTSKVCYIIKPISNEPDAVIPNYCPTYGDFGGDNQCTN